MVSLQFVELSLVDLVSKNYIFSRESVCGLISDARENKEMLLSLQRGSKLKSLEFLDWAY